MQLDWLTIAAQIVNFLVLVWLLQRFLYRPIVNAMRRREDRIEERLTEAKSARQEAEDEAGRLKAQQEDLEASKEEILEDTREEARALRRRLEADLREEMEDKRDAWKAHLADERDDFVHAIRQQAGQQVLAITGRILAEFSGGGDLSDQVAATFVARLQDLDAETRDKLAAAATHSDAAARVETGAGVSSQTKAKTTRAIHEALSTDIGVDYRKAEDLVLGVRLIIGDQTLEWSAARYLNRLENEFGELLDVEGHSEAGTRSDGQMSA